MEKIKLFLAASPTELQQDRETIGDLINNLNNQYQNRGLIFQLIQTNTHEEITPEMIGDCTTVFIIFFKEKDNTVMEAFDQAYAQFKANETPKIITIFKEDQEDAGFTEEATQFMNQIDKELNHFYQTYQHMDTLRFHMLLQLSLLSNTISVECKDGQVLVDHQTFMSMTDLPAAQRNQKLQAIKDKLEQTTKDFYAAQEQYSKNPDDMECIKKIYELGTKRQEQQDTVNQMEEDLFKALRAMAENLGKKQSQRSREAYRLLEAGDIDGANEVLNIKELKEATQHVQNLANERMAQAKAEIEAIQRPIIDEWLQKINLLKLKVDDPNRFKAIKECYEEACQLEKTNELEPLAMYAYASYLRDQNQHQSGIKWAKQALAFYDGKEEYLSKQGIVYNLLGILLSDTNRYPEAEEAYRQALTIYEKLAKSNLEAYEPNLAISYNNLGTLLRATNRYPEAEEAYCQAIAIREKLAETNPEAYESDVAMSYNNLGLLLRNTNRYPEAEEAYRQALTIYKKLAKATPEAYEPYLAGSYNNLGILLRNTNRYPEAEEAYHQAVAIYKKLAETNPEAYEPDVAMSYNNLGNLLRDTNRYPEAEEAYRKALAIQEKLVETNPEVYEPDVAMSYNNLGLLLSDTKRYPEAEEAYRQALAIRKKLAKATPEAYESDLADSYNNLGLLLSDTKRYPEAEEAYRQALAIREKLAETNPKAYESDLAMSYNNLATLLHKTKRYPEAEEAYRQALDIYEKLAKVNPEAYELNLALTYRNYGILQKNRDSAEAKQAWQSALTIYLKWKDRVDVSDKIDTLEKWINEIKGINNNEQSKSKKKTNRFKQWFLNQFKK